MKKSELKRASEIQLGPTYFLLSFGELSENDVKRGDSSIEGEM